MKTRLLGKGKLAGGLGLLLALALLVSFTTPAFAFPQPPHTFKGSVTICGTQAEQDTVVSARINDIEYSTTEVDGDGNYGVFPAFTVPADDPATPPKEGGVDGEWVQFYVHDKLAGQAQFARLALTILDLNVTLVDLTVTSEGCCPITVDYDAVSEIVPAGDSEVFEDIPCSTDVTVGVDDSGVCCQFDSWSDAGAQTHVITMDGFKNVTATCTVPGPYALTVTSDGCCPIDVTYEGFYDQVAAGGTEVFGGIPCSTDVTVSADDSGVCCQFDSWSDAGAQTHVIHMDDDKSVTATCTVPGPYDLTVTSDGCCPIDVTYEGFSGQVAAGNIEVFEGIPCSTDVTVSADDSDVCCQFDSWSDAGAQTHVITMNGDKSVTATCTVPGPYDLTVTSDGCCPITVEYDAVSEIVPAGDSEVFEDIPCSTDVTVSADDSDAICLFDSWSDAGAQTHVITMNGDKSVTATCLTAGTYYTLTVTSDGCCPITVEYGVVSETVLIGTSDDFNIAEDTAVQLTATAGDCCSFDGWEVDGSPAAGNPIIVTMDDNHTAIATCSEPGPYTLTVTSDGCCPITVEYDEVSEIVLADATEEFTSISCGTEVELTATAGDCCSFDGWEVDGSPAAGNPITVTMDDNHTAIATCPELGPYTLTATASPAEAGIVTATGMVDGIGTYDCCTTVDDVLATTTDPCYYFDHWSGDLSDSTNPESIHIDGNKAVTAHFLPAVADVLMNIDLVAGWNTFSTPVALHPCWDTWDELLALSGIENDVEIIYYYDGSTQLWLPVTAGQVRPLDGFFVKLQDESSGGAVPIIAHPASPVPPSKEVYTGANLIGPAPASLEDEDVVTVLATIYYAEGENLPPGYSLVISPPVNDDWPVYYRETPEPPTSDEEMQIGRAYWVIMENPDILWGSSTTPIP